MAREKIPFKKGRRECLFCGGTPVSKEHIWPEWSHPMLPQGGRRGDFRLQGSRSARQVKTEMHRRRDGAFYTIQIKRACVPCNTGWMSRSEERVRPFVERMIVGDPVILSPTDKALLTEYLTYKIMLMDWLHEKPVLTLEHGKAFHEHREMPPNLRMIICNCYEGLWRGKFSGVEIPYYKAEDLTPESPSNTKSFAMGIGNLFVFALTSGVDIQMNVNPASAGQLWPMTDGPLHWPPKFPIASNEAEFISQTLLRLGGDKVAVVEEG